MYKRNLPAFTMKHPTGNQVFGDGKLWKASDVNPSKMTNDEAASRTPCSVDTVTDTIVSTWTGDICLIQRIIVGDVVMVL